MIQIVLTKYWVLAHLLVTAGTLCCLPTLSPVGGIWCAVSLLIMMFFLPPIRKGESFWLVRARISQSTWRDVVLYASFLAFLYVGSQVMNGPREFIFEPELKRWIYELPSWRGLPSSVNPADGVPFFVGLTAGLACAVAIRNALPRKQCLYLLLGLGGLGTLLVVGGLLVTLCSGAQPAFAWCGGAFGMGTLCLLLFCVQLGIALEAFLEGHRKMLAWALVAAVFAEMGVLVFGTITVKLLMLLLAVIYILLSLFVVRGGGRYPKVLWCVVLLLPVLFGFGLGLALMQSGDVSMLFTPSMWTDGYTAFCDQWTFRAGLGFEVFADEPMLGSGPAGLAYFAEHHLETRLDWALWQQGGTGFMCDLFALMTQCGMVGTLLLLIPGGALLGRCLMQLVEYLANRASPHRVHYSLRYLFVLFGSAAGVVSVLMLSFIGTPLHAPAVLVVFLIVSACMGEWMPRKR